MLPSKVQNAQNTDTSYASNALHYPPEQSQQRLQIKDQSNSQQLNTTCFDPSIHPLPR